jgi:phage terminase small subunit
MNDKEHKLTAKQQAFVAHFLVCMNASEAARRAGYPEKSAHAVGYENLRKPYIKALIDKGIAENVMSQNEILARFSDMARASIDDVMNEDDEFDLSLARRQGKMHLIKSIKRREFTDKDGNTTRTTEYELHDAQSALVNLGKYYSMFTTKVKIEDWQDKVVEGLKQGKIDPQEVVKEFGNNLATNLFIRAGVPVGQSREVAEAADPPAPGAGDG